MNLCFSNLGEVTFYNKKKMVVIYQLIRLIIIKSGDSSAQNQKCILFLLPVELFINLDSFGVSCLVLEILAEGISAFSLI